jgi:hypothetical protein
MKITKYLRYPLKRCLPRMAFLHRAILVPLTPQREVTKTGN